MRLMRIVALSLILFCHAGMGQAQDFQKGSTAYRAGDYKAALREFRPLAEQGNADAQFLIGSMYFNGQGLLQDYAEAARWYLLAAEQGDAYAQVDLGIMYKNGQGLLQDYAEAARWFRLAAKQGDAYAQSLLGMAYAIGLGVPKDLVMSHMWTNIASANGDSSASKTRNEITLFMTTEEISEAKAMAGKCFSSGYKKCGY